jgi:hypothetical protein
MIRRAISRAALAVVLSLAATLGCSQSRSGPRWASDVAAAHREADARVDAGDLTGARARLRALVDAQESEAGSEPPANPERRLALQDTYFRLSQLALAAHEPHQALADADAGLAFGDAPHVFVANLLVARGAAREAVGDPRGAATDYHRALSMNETLLAAALGRPEPRP